jgi:recombination protein RecT
MALVQKKRTVADLINSDKTRLEIAKVLPKHLTPERMCRVALTATMRNPALLECSPASLMNALLTCSQAGLEPDGRLAHLIPYGQIVQVIFDYKGLVTLALRNGAESVYGDKVCEFDLFEAYVQDGIKKLNHRPNWAKPRGTPICYYAVCKRSGEVDWEVMTTVEVQDIRQRSRAKDKGPWVTDFDEMAKKTVLRRMSKRWDLLPEIRDVINADDDTPPPFGAATVSAPIFDMPKALPAKPEAELENGHAPEPEPTPQPAPEPEPQQAKSPEPAGSNPRGGFNPLKALRSLLKIEKLKEGDVLDYWASSGNTDGSASSLEEVQISKPELVSWCAENWTEFLSKYNTMVRKEGAE